MHESGPAVTLQINLTPQDLRYARETLPHQLRQCAGQVQEVLCTVDAPNGVGEELPRFLDGLCGSYPHMRWLEVDRSPGMVARIRSRYVTGRRVPPTDYKGSPIYSYFAGFDTARFDYIFHLDADMFIGGGSQTWVGEAVQLLRERDDLLICSPLPGPPRPDRRLMNNPSAPEPHYSPAYRFEALSTRVCILDRKRLLEGIAPVTLEFAPLRRLPGAFLRGFPPYHLLEAVLSRAMKRRGYWRVDFLGHDPGMWSLHPNTRSARFFQLLPTLVAAVEDNRMPTLQLGEYDLQEGTLDWLEKAAPARDLAHLEA